MTEAEAIKILEKEKAYMDSHGGDIQSNALGMAIKALEKQIELRENCEGSCIDCKYRGEFHCANDLLIGSEV